jgi:hypothetical protein
MTYWLQGRTVNISRTGVLFQTDGKIGAKSVLNIRIDLPKEMTLSCQGSVVRTEKSTCAVKFHRYNLGPADARLPDSLQLDEKLRKP